MGGWPELAQLMGQMPNISGFNICSVVAGLGQQPTMSSSTWPAANRAVFIPFRLAVPITVTQFWLLNGETVPGTEHFDIGVYDLAGTKIASTGSTDQTGVSVLQTVDVTDFTIGPGGFYLACAMDTNTATILDIWPTLECCRLVGLAEQASAFPLPATATLAVITFNSIQAFGLSTRTTV